MKDKHKRLWWCDRLRIGLLIGMLITAMLGQAKPGPLFLILALLLFFALCGVEAAMNRCPHCGRYLNRNRGCFCQYCAQPIREEKTET